TASGSGPASLNWSIVHGLFMFAAFARGAWTRKRSTDIPPPLSNSLSLWESANEPSSSKVSVHVDRAAGGHRHHCDPDWVATAGSAKSARGGRSFRLPEQSEANRVSSPQLRVVVRPIASGHGCAACRLPGLHASVLGAGRAVSAVSAPADVVPV